MPDPSQTGRSPNACYPPDIFRPVVVPENARWAVPPALQCDGSVDRHDEIVVVPRETAEAAFKHKRIEISLAVGHFISHHLSELKDVGHMREVVQEFGIAGRAYTKLINGKAYVILKGRPGLRTL